VKTGPVKTIPTAGVRVVFSVETCDGDPVPDLLEQGSMEIINDETGKPFGSEGDAAPSVGEAKDFSFYTIVVLDLSYSVVNNGSLEAELNGAISLVEQLVEQPQDDRQKHNVALYVFGSTSQSELLQGFTKNHALLYQHLEALKSDPGKGSTNLYGAYKTALDLIELQGLDEEKVQRSVILMTDGTHETGDADELEAESLVKLSESTANVYTIGLAGDYDEEKLQVLASAPENFLLASEASELVAAFQSIAAAVAAWAKSNYVLGVCSPLEGPDRSLTLTATYGLMTGSVTAEYDATGFDLTGCDPVYVADPCGAVDCGVMEGLQCNSCSGELVCIENFCEDKLCVPDALYCAGQTVMQCDGEGASASPVSSCNSSSEFCKQQGDDAWCTPHVCDPGEPFCDGDTSYTCNSEGSGSEEDTEINCSSAGLLCNAGICTSQICVPSTKFCEDNAVQKCNGDGSDYLELDACTGSEYCEENPPTASCNAPSPLGSEDNPAQSCKEILDAGASTGDGMYWIDPDGFGQAPNYSPFEVHCDMTTDGGGWIRIAQTDGAINIDANDYLNGFEPSPACAEVGLPALDECETHVIDCHKYSALQTSAATFLVKMGNVKDYYRPKGAFSFCEMLVSHNRHLWNNQATGVFEQPCYSNTPHLGGSCGSLKPDGRWFLSNWGDDSWYNNLGGCCSLDYGSTDGEWGDPFEFFVREAAPTIPDGYLGSQENPAQSCKEILDAGASTGDGMYWLDWGTSGGFQAKCDMSGANAGFTRLNTPLLKSADLVDFITPYTEPAGQSWWDESGGFVLTPYNGNSNCQGIVVRAEVVVPSGFQEWFGSWSAIGHASGTNCDDHFNPFPLNMWGDSDTSVSCGGWIKFGTENHLSKQGGEWGIDWSPGAVIKHWDWLQQDIPTSTLIRWEVGDDKEIDMVRFFDIDIWIR
jgi:hypothetical protein